MQDGSFYDSANEEAKPKVKSLLYDIEEFEM